MTMFSFGRMRWTVVGVVVLLTMSSAFVQANYDDEQHIRDTRDNCAELVQQDKCRTDPHDMFEHCRYSCSKWAQEQEKSQSVTIQDEDPSFFDLEAQNSTGSPLHFDRFEGYITLVINVPKTCIKDNVEQAYHIFESLQRVWPYTVEILLFTFEHPEMDYSIIDDCQAFRESFHKPGRSIHVMEEVDINGPKTHPVYKYLKGLFNLTDLETNFSTYFLITPNGDSIEMYRGSSEEQLKLAIRTHLDRDL